MKQVETFNRWGLFWWCPKKALARNKPGATYHSEHLAFEDGKPMLFKTRSEARKFAQEKYDYTKNRKDLRDYPHYWRMPKPCRITGIMFNKP